jgi:hypothetical protein
MSEAAGVFIMVLAICLPIHLTAERQPSRLPRNAFERLSHSWLTRARFYFLAFVRALNFALPFHVLSRRRGWGELGLAVVGAVLIWNAGPPLEAPPTALFMGNAFMGNAMLLRLAGLLVALAFALGIWVAARFIFQLFDPTRSNGWNRREILLLIPLGQLITGSTAWGIIRPSEVSYGAIGILVVVLAIGAGIHLKAAWPRDTLFALALLIVFSAATYRFDNPYSWYNYQEKPMFADRVWYRHPAYGPMLIERDLLQMIQPVCQKIRDSGSDNELLSLPWPGGNYFCSIPPWHGYVQTFFDTAGKQAIQNLMDLLQQSPPKWILYQRQLMTLRFHEITYNQGNPIQQRYLGQLIEQQIRNGIWRIAYVSDYGTRHFLGRQWDTEWILIQTR